MKSRPTKPRQHCAKARACDKLAALTKEECRLKPNSNRRKRATTHKTEGLRILLRRAAIQKRVTAVAREITCDFPGERVHLIGVLKGACIFLADLIREIDLDTSIDFMAVASYGKNKESSGQVRLNKDLDSNIAGLNVILVEDILDTGLTLSYLRRILLERKPKTLKIAALLDKPSRRILDIEADYVGFTIPNEFVVGYGLDYGERYRNLKDVCVLDVPTAEDSHR